MYRNYITLAFVYNSVFAIGVLLYGTNSQNTIPLISLISFVILLISFVYFGIPNQSRIAFILTITVMVLVTALTFAQLVPTQTFQFTSMSWLLVQEQNIASTPRITVTPGDSMLALLKFGMPFSVFMASLIIFNDDERALHALNFTALISGILSLLAILQFNFWPETLLLAKKTHYISSLTGSFINRNTAGSFFGLGSLVIASLITYYIQLLFAVKSSYDLKSKNYIIIKIYLFIFLISSSISALLLTQSRGAFIATFISFFIFFVTISIKNFRYISIPSYRSAIALLTLTSVFIIIAFIFFTLASRVMLRAEVENLDSENRFCIIPGISQASSENWPLGAGIASFREIFPAYRNPDCGIRGVWDKAHNFYMEGILSLGLGFVLVMLISVSALFILFFRGVKTRKRFHFAGALGVASLTLVLTHAVVDFSIQIPGFAIFFAAVCAPLVTLCSRR